MFTEKNSIYLIAGYAVFLGGIAIYLLSLAVRRRNLRRDEELLTEIEQQLEQQPDTPATARPEATRITHQEN
jgi:hypothetical protein